MKSSSRYGTEILCQCYTKVLWYNVLCIVSRCCWIMIPIMQFVYLQSKKAVPTQLLDPLFWDSTYFLFWKESSVQRILVFRSDIVLICYLVTSHDPILLKTPRKITFYGSYWDLRHKKQCKITLFPTFPNARDIITFTLFSTAKQYKKTDRHTHNTGFFHLF